MHHVQDRKSIFCQNCELKQLPPLISGQVTLATYIKNSLPEMKVHSELATDLAGA